MHFLCRCSGSQLTEAVCYGLIRLNGKKKEGPLVIPALANRDWREVARKRKASEMFVPDGGRAAVATGADGSVGGLGTTDTINSGPQSVGLIKSEKKMKMDVDEDIQSSNEGSDMEPAELEPEETEDEKARKALLAISRGERSDSGFTIDAIPLTSEGNGGPISETDAYRQDVVTRPDSVSMSQISPNYVLFVLIIVS